MITITVSSSKNNEKHGPLALDISQLVRKKRKTAIVEVHDERVEGKLPAHESTDVHVVIES